MFNRTHTNKQRLRFKSNLIKLNFRLKAIFLGLIVIKYTKTVTPNSDNIYLKFCFNQISVIILLLSYRKTWILKGIKDDELRNAFLFFS